ncbi:cytochrome P450 6k1-like [Athalia rosae]|uniref:cytochrome P450 6k1-like n=1 Tax=Athalia rosae TaxID=37344 RepID=UPI002033EA13|nr:cytochrome P450 6k1-like [Athalia rosae]
MEMLPSSWLANGVSLILLLFGLFYVYSKFKLRYWKNRGVPSLPANFIFGNFKDAVLVRESPGNVMATLYEHSKKSQFIGFYVFHKPCLLVTHPDLLRHILIKDFDVFPNRLFGTGATRDIPASKNLFSLNNPEWKYVRSKISPALTSGKLKKMVPLMIESAQSMLDYINSCPTDGNSFKHMKIHDTASKYANEIISSLAFGIKTNSYEIPETKFQAMSRELFAITPRRVFDLFVIFFFPEWCDKTRTSMFGSTESFFRDVFWNSLNVREQSGQKRGDLIDSLIQLRNEEKDPRFHFDGDHLLAHSAIFFLAGQGTTTTTLAFALWQLALNPEIQERVRHEVKEQLANHGLTLEAFQEMKYLNQIISETLRLFPPAPILDRLAMKDYKIPGSDVVIEKGTVVYVPLCGLHWDPEYFPDPMKFDPDRFSDERKSSILPMTYMPFGVGPRNCIGQRLGMIQTLIGLALILSEYEVSLDPDNKNSVDPKALFLAPLDDIYLYLKKVE